MIRLLLPLLLLLAIPFAGRGMAQQYGGTDQRELRGVWLTTLLGLDWPQASLRGNIEAQKKALRTILDDVRRKNFNTVFFQVRSRGNALYRSTLEPWCSELTGTLGKDPGWDPLAFAITEARERGLELHAWFNVFRVWSAGAPPQSSPPHLALAYPSWVRRFGDDLWMDPGIPEAREYTLRVMEELVRNYDIDGIHLDYCRYADRGFDDEATWRRYGENGMTKDDWRRNNVNALVEAAYKRLSAIRPSLIVGSAPIGIYQNLPTARGWEGRNAISQDSRAWLAGGYHDYVVPQMYWGLSRNGSRIDFEALVADWSRNASGRHVHAGVAAYKEDIHPHLAEHVDAARAQGASGVVFFRYEHIRDAGFSGRFDRKMLPPPLTWKDAIPPNPVRNLRRSPDEHGTRWSWDAPLAAPDGESARWYAVMERRDGGRRVLRELLPAHTTHFVAGEATAEIRILAVDRARNLSRDDEETLVATTKPVAHGRSPEARAARAVFVADDLMLLGYELPRPAHVRLRLLDEDSAELALLYDGYADAGVHVLGVELDKLDGEAAHTVFESGELRVVLPVVSYQP
ncbi:MAG: family 10 glycosylhydrolase [Bacteroidia bacterium]|nr:family 10 glycosylhydrolase [Bacteroidia bacterium]